MEFICGTRDNQSGTVSMETAIETKLDRVLDEKVGNDAFIIPELSRNHYSAKPFIVLLTPRGCLEVISHRRNHQGYGVLRWQGRQQLAHRIVWQLYYGCIPEDKRILHHCDNPPCINPQHLFIGTQEDNVRDMWRKGRGCRKSVGCGESHPMAKLTAEQVRYIRHMVSTGQSTQGDMMRKFKVSRSMISLIILNKNWRDA